jgi:hypothetical protein
MFVGRHYLRLNIRKPNFNAVIGRVAAEGAPRGQLRWRALGVGLARRHLSSGG